VHKIVSGLMITKTDINNPDTQGRAHLVWAIIKDDSSAVSTLLESGADPDIVDNVGNVCLHSVESTEVFGALVSGGADLHAVTRYWEWSPSHSLCKRSGTRNVDLIECFFSSGIDIDVRYFQRETPLFSALIRGQVSSARRLIELGVDVSAANRKSGDSALHFAVMCNDHSNLPLLLEKGCRLQSNQLCRLEHPPYCSTDK